MEDQSNTDDGSANCEPRFNGHFNQFVESVNGMST